LRDAPPQAGHARAPALLEFVERLQAVAAGAQRMRRWSGGKRSCAPWSSSATCFLEGSIPNLRLWKSTHSTASRS
jgi:hypothetical protein